jgi:hypothetical protein
MNEYWRELVAHAHGWATGAGYVWANGHHFNFQWSLGTDSDRRVLLAALAEQLVSQIEEAGYRVGVGPDRTTIFPAGGYRGLFVSAGPNRTENTLSACIDYYRSQAQ